MNSLTDLNGWIAYLTEGLKSFEDCDLDDDSRADLLLEMIDKPHRRGVINDDTADALMRHFGLAW